MEVSGQPTGNVCGKTAASKGVCAVALLALLILGTGIHAEWFAWTSYKLYSSAEYSIEVILQDGSAVPVTTGEIKVFRNHSRVDIQAMDKASIDMHFAPRKIVLRRK